MKRRESKKESQVSRTFQYHERMASIVRDLENIDRLIPAESSRYGCLMDSKKQGEAVAIIEARKSELLGYIQVICRDHILWAKHCMKDGWEVKDAH